jgi:hypothetical protein
MKLRFLLIRVYLFAPVVSGIIIYPKHYIFTESYDTSYEAIYFVHDVSTHMLTFVEPGLTSDTVQ